MKRWLWLVALVVLLWGAVGVAAQGQGTRPPRGERLPPLPPQQVGGTTGVRSEVIFFPAADSYIASNRADDNFGDSTGLLLGYSIGSVNYGAERILLRFDLANTIPANATIHSARLQLYLNSATPTDDPPMRVILRSLEAEWEEYAVSWNREPTWGPIQAESLVGSAPGPYEWQITALVTDWVRGNLPNRGVELLGDEQVQQRERLFYAREVGDTALIPRLIVDYTAGSNDTEAPVVAVDALPAYSPRTFTVSWRGYDQGDAGIAYYDVQYRAEGGSWVDWQSATTAMSASFTGQNGVRYEFRARGVDQAGNVEPWGAAEAGTVVDSRLPTARVNPLPNVMRQREFIVSWSGTDGSEGSGIQCYEVRVRRVEAGGWQLWQSCTSDTSALFTAPADGSYQFEARARDNLGHEEPFTGQPEAQTLVDAASPFLVPRLWVPVAIR